VDRGPYGDVRLAGPEGAAAYVSLLG